MKNARWIGGLSLVLGALGCGGSAPPEESAATVTTTGGETPPLPPAARAPESPFLAVVHVDLARVRSDARLLQLARLWRDRALSEDAEARARWSSAGTACGGDPVDVIDSITVGFGATRETSDEPVMLVRARVNDPVACLQAAFGPTATARAMPSCAAGDPGCVIPETLIEDFAGGYLLRAPERNVTAAERTALATHAPDPTSALVAVTLDARVGRRLEPIPPRLGPMIPGIDPERVRVLLEAMTSVLLHVVPEGDSVRITLAVDQPTDELAGEARGMLDVLVLGARAMLAQVPPVDATSGEVTHPVAGMVDAARPVLETLAAFQEAHRAGVRIDLTAAVIERLSTAAQEAFGQYVLRSKAAEARTLLNTLFAAYAAHVAEFGGTPRARLRNAPLTPRQVARGTTYTPDARTFSHATWQALRFAPTDAMRFSYQVVVQGDAVTFRAQGDLDGDGALSTFELRTRLTADGLVRDGDIVETNPLE